MRPIFLALALLMLASPAVATECRTLHTLPCATNEDDLNAIMSMVQSKDDAGLGGMIRQGRIVHIPQGSRVYREDVSFWSQTTKVNYQGRSCWWYSDAFKCN